MRNRMFMHTARDDNVLGAEPPKSRKSQKKSDSAISSEESPSKKKYAKDKKVAAAKSKPTKKKAPVKADRGKGDGTDFESGVPDEQHRKTSSTNEGTGTKSWVPGVPKYDSESKKESWGDSREEDDDENDSEDEDDDDDGKDDDGNDGDGDDDDANDDDNQEDDDTDDDDEETDSDRTESDIIKIPILNQSSTKYYKEEEEKIDDEETIDEEEDDEVTKELYNDVNVNLGNKDADMTDADQGGTDHQNVSQESGFEQVEEDAHVTLTPILDTQKTDEQVQSSSISSDFTSKLLNLENPSLAENEIASLIDTTVRHGEPRSQTSSLYTVPVMATPDVASVFTTTIPLPPPFFNPLPQQATPTPTPTTYEATTSFPLLLNFSSVFNFNDRFTNLEKDLEEAQAENRDYIELIDTSMRAILKEEVNTQLP
ncbi:hypothetical protein Tco_1444746 [Tanacetum coccineum]